MSFRARIALATAAAVAIAVVAASGVVYLVVKDELYSSVDASLRSSMQVIQHAPPDTNLADGPPQPGVFGGEGPTSGLDRQVQGRDFEDGLGDVLTGYLRLKEAAGRSA
jgi:hypothetical protein